MTTKLTPEQQEAASALERTRLRINRALFQMPYLPMVASGKIAIPEGATVEGMGDALVSILTELTDVLRREGDAARRTEADLDILRRDLAAVRRVFGTGA